jgi:molecular chaperone Hsp33
MAAAGKANTGETDADEWQATAMILQRIAADGGHSNAGDVALSDDAWHTAKTLMQSVRRDELVDPALGPEALIFRLFNSMEPHVAPAKDVRDQCRCSPQRVETMLKQLNPDEIAELGDDDGFIDINCEFCKTNRRISVDTIGA